MSASRPASRSIPAIASAGPAVEPCFEPYAMRTRSVMSQAHRSPRRSPSVLYRGLEGISPAGRSLHTVGTKEGTRTNRRTRKLAAAWVAALSLALATAGAASAVGASQTVGGVVESQFGVAVAPDGTIRGNSSTIDVSVKKTVENGVEVITITPRD